MQNLELEIKAREILNNSFNEINFKLFEKAIGDEILDYIMRPSDEAIAEIMDKEELKGLTKKERKEKIDEFYELNDNYPFWGTIFEAKDEFINDKIMNDIDELYKLGIGVIAPTDYTRACLFIKGAGYNFYEAHWIPMLIHWGLLGND